MMLERACRAKKRYPLSCSQKKGGGGGGPGGWNGGEGARLIFLCIT